MKMLINSLVFFAIMISLWVWFSFTQVEPVVKYYEEDLTKLSYLIEDNKWEDANSKTGEHLLYWEKVKKVWIFFVHQSDIEKIDASIKKLNVYIKNNNKVMAQAEIEELKVLINVVKANEDTAIDNIF